MKEKLATKEFIEWFDKETEYEFETVEIFLENVEDERYLMMFKLQFLSEKGIRILRPIFDMWLVVSGADEPAIINNKDEIEGYKLAISKGMELL